MIIVGLSVDFVLVIVTGKQKFPFKCFWHNFLFTSLGVPNVKYVHVKQTLSRSYSKQEWLCIVIGTGLHVLEDSGTLLLSKPFICLRTFLFFSP